MISEAAETKISESTFSHPCSKFLATAKVDLAHYDSFRGGGSHSQSLIFSILILKPPAIMPEYQRFILGMSCIADCIKLNRLSFLRILSAKLMDDLANISLKNENKTVENMFAPGRICRKRSTNSYYG